VTYLEKKAPAYCFYHAPVAAFYAWFRDFPFTPFFNDTVKGRGKGKVKWEYRMIFLNPFFPDVTGSDAILLKWTQDCVSKFT
jgi:hypothetical protein